MPHQPKLLRVYGETDFITGLRAIAATMVVIIHTGAFADFGKVGHTITYGGKYGVDIFFVISGFTIAKTFTEAKDYKSYLLRRIIRIVPLYWLTISVAMFFLVSGLYSMPEGMQNPETLSYLYNYLMHLSLLSYLDYRIANSVLGVEWTIPIEVFWYVCLPPIIYFGRTVRRTIGTILVFILITALLSFISKQIFGTSQPIKWSPIAYGHLFFLGVASYYLRGKLRTVRSVRPKIWISGAFISFILALIVEFDGRSEILAFSTAVMIVWVTPARTTWLTWLLTSRPMLFLGSISYSIYLIHPLVIHLLGDYAMLPASGIGKFLVVYAVTIAVSTVTYLLVEKPTNQAGRNLVAG
ncbi:MAG: acyltransferase family protein [Sulfitobacter sp.]